MKDVKFVNTSDNFLEVLNNYDTVDIEEISKKLLKELSKVSDFLRKENIHLLDYDISLKIYELIIQHSLVYCILRESIYLDVSIARYFASIARLNYRKENNLSDTFITTEQTRIEGKAYLDAISKFKYKE